MSHGRKFRSQRQPTGDFFRHISIDTWTGMLISNLIAFFIIVTTAVTLNAHGITRIDTAAQAAEALRPIAGELTLALFAAGIIGTGLLAVPVLAGSAAYAVAETFGSPRKSRAAGRPRTRLLRHRRRGHPRRRRTRRHQHRSHRHAVLDCGHKRRGRCADHGCDDAGGLGRQRPKVGVAATLAHAVGMAGSGADGSRRRPALMVELWRLERPRRPSTSARACPSRPTAPAPRLPAP